MPRQAGSTKTTTARKSTAKTTAKSASSRKTANAKSSVSAKTPRANAKAATGLNAAGNRRGMVKKSTVNVNARGAKPATAKTATRRKSAATQAAA